MLPQRLSNYTVASVALSLFFHVLLAFFIHQRSNKPTLDLSKIIHPKDKQPPKVLPYLERLLQRPKPLQAQLDTPSSQSDLKKLLQPPVKIQANIDRLVKPEQVNSTPAKLSTAPGEKSPLLQTLPPQIYQITDLQNPALSPKNITPPIARILNPDALLPIASKQGGSTDTRVNFGGPGQAGKITLPLIRATPGLDLGAPELGDPNKQDVRVTQDAKLPEIKLKEERTPGRLDELLTISSFVYIDPSDGQGYFRVDITPNERSARLESVPKDILFLLDTSASIGTNQLKQFTQALAHGVSLLKKQDRFNIVSFTTSNRPLFKDYQTATAENRRAALNFLDKARRGGRTDVYEALKPFINGYKQKNKRPLLIFIATDGVSTTWSSPRNAELIRSITAENQSNISIFALSSGDDINSFMIDLLTLRNLGYSMKRKVINQSGETFSRHLEAYSDPVVSDLKAQLSPNMNTDNIYPKKLPHLYRNGTLSLYGLYNPTKDKHAFIRIYGQGPTSKEEVVFKVDFADSVIEGRTLAKGWAARKLFHLLGQLTEEKDKEQQLKVSNTIDGISFKHEIKIPYDYKDELKE